MLSTYASIQNAFSRALSRFDFNVFDILTVDVMHEWDLGVGKALYTYLIEVLAYYDTKAVTEFNRRLVSEPLSTSISLTEIHTDVE